jgi:hypothetical protein
MVKQDVQNEPRSRARDEQLLRLQILECRLLLCDDAINASFRLFYSCFGVESTKAGPASSMIDVIPQTNVRSKQDQLAVARARPVSASIYQKMGT